MKQYKKPYDNPELTKDKSYANILSERTDIKMSEQAQKHGSLNPEEMQFQESALLFEGQLGVLGQNVPEITQNIEAITESGKEIINQFGIKPELFEDEGRALIFASIANRWSGPKTEDDKAEKTFLHDSIALLAHAYSDKLTDAHKQITDNGGNRISDEAKLLAYDKYTDKELSVKLTEAIAGGLLDGVKERLEVNDENEDPYEIRVLSVDSGNQTHGIYAPKPDYDLPNGHPDYQLALDTYKQVEEWKKGLERRGISFANELGRDSLFGPAWVTEIGGKRLLCISTGLAEKITNPGATENTDFYDEKDAERDFAILEHEYTHTQGGLMLDREISFGINIEELRAEYFSGNRGGYQDIKSFFLDYATVVGEHPTTTFESLGKGGTCSEVFGDIANKAGLNRMLEVVMASPKNYIESQSNKYAREAYTYLGGFDGVVGRLIEDQIAAGNSDQLEERIVKRAKKIAEYAGKDGNDWLWDYRRQQGLNVMTDLVNKKAEELGLKVAA